MRKRVAVIIVLILLIVISLVAYYAWLSPIPSGIPSSERGESQETVKFIEVVDALGRTVKIRAPINKVIITGRGS
ncbi:MAG: hypothetical protein QXY57_01065, partial [Candidatus Bathyarchaeia archaeon]